MQDDNYELMPHNELEYLRHEVAKLKRNPLGDTQTSISLLDSLNKLNTSVTRLNDVLTGANDEMVKAYNEASTQEQMRKILEQQEKLARGIVAVAELVKEVQKKQQSMPDFDTFLAQMKQNAPAAAPAPAAPAVPPIPAEAVAVTARNPFLDGAPREFAPILNQPLPHPGNMPQPGMPQAMTAGVPPLGAPAIPPQNAPGFMLNPGVQEPPRQPNMAPPRIDDIEIPLPPRRY